MTPSPSKADPRVRAACEAALVLAGPNDTHALSVSPLAENVTRALRMAKEGMSDSDDVSRTVRRELHLAVMGTPGARLLALGVVRLLVECLEDALRKSLAPEDRPTTPTLGFDKFRVSPTESYVKALEEAMLRGLGPQAPLRIEYRPLSGEVHFNGGDAVDLETRWMRNTWTGVRRDGDPVDLEYNPLFGDAWVETRKPGLAVEGTRENGLAVEGTHEKGSAVTENKRTEA